MNHYHLLYTILYPSPGFGHNCFCSPIVSVAGKSA